MDAYGIGRDLNSRRSITYLEEKSYFMDFNKIFPFLL